MKCKVIRWILLTVAVLVITRSIPTAPWLIEVSPAVIPSVTSLCNKSEWNLYSQLTIHASLFIYFLFNTAYFFSTLRLRTGFRTDPCYCSRWWRVDHLLSLNAALLRSYRLLTRLFRLFTSLVLVVGLTRRKVRSANFHRLLFKDSFFWLLLYRELCLSIGSRWIYPGVPSLNGFS